MINSERFEEILEQKYYNGIHTFTGNFSHNVYTIQNPTNHRMKWTLFINNKPARVNTNFFSIACEIYDTEREYMMNYTTAKTD